MFDRKLRFKEHLDKVLKKGNKIASAIAGISRSNWGPEFKYLVRLFNAVAAPRMDYRAIIWHRPKDNKAAAISQLGKLSTIQRQIMRPILGCFRTTPTSALEVESTLIPPQYRLTLKILFTVLCMKTTPLQHPIRKWIERASQIGGGRPYESNLENLVRQYPQIYNTPVETILPYIKPPWWSLPIEIRIATSKKEAYEQHAASLQQATQGNMLVAYTDGSCIDSKVDAACYCPAEGKVVQKFIGTDKEANVFMAGLDAINMALRIVQSPPIEAYKGCIIYVIRKQKPQLSLSFHN